MNESTKSALLLSKQINSIHGAQSTQVRLSGHANAYVVYRYTGTGHGAPMYQSITVDGWNKHVRHEDNEIVATVLSSGEVLYPDTIIGGVK